MSLEEAVEGLQQLLVLLLLVLLVLLLLLLLLLLLRAHSIGRGGRNIGGHLGLRLRLRRGLGLDGPWGGIRR